MERTRCYKLVLRMGFAAILGLLMVAGCAKDPQVLVTPFVMRAPIPPPAGMEERISVSEQQSPSDSSQAKLQTAGKEPAQ